MFFQHVTQEIKVQRFFQEIIATCVKGGRPEVRFGSPTNKNNRSLTTVAQLSDSTCGPQAVEKRKSPVHQNQIWNRAFGKHHCLFTVCSLDYRVTTHSQHCAEHQARVRMIVSYQDKRALARG